MERPVDTIFTEHLSRTTVNIDLYDMLAWIQNAYGVLNGLTFERYATRNEKIQQRPRPDLYPVLDYLITNGRPAVSDAISKDVLRAVIQFEDRIQTDPLLPPNAVQTDESEMTKHAESQTHSIQVASCEMMTNISNDGAMKELIQKIDEEYKEIKGKDSRIVRIGGTGEGRTVEIFHPTITSVPHIVRLNSHMIPIKCHKCHVIDKDRLLVVGGRRDQDQTEKDETFASSTVINLNSFELSLGPSLPKPIDCSALVSLNAAVNGITSLYLCGGQQSADIRDATNLCYKLQILDNNKDDLCHQKWTKLQCSLNIARVNHSVSVLNGCLFAIGGHNVKVASLKSVECYNPSAGDSADWTELPGQLNDGRHWAASLTHRGKIWVTGGGNDGSPTLNTTEVFDPSIGTWTYGPPLNQQRSCHCMVEFNEKMYVLGGYENSQTIEVFNDQTHQWDLLKDFLLEKSFMFGDCVVID